MDRNAVLCGLIIKISVSLSARRAWIEIQAILVKVVDFPSLSARRAWIEIIIVSSLSSKEAKVALRKESVDRNASLR